MASLGLGWLDGLLLAIILLLAVGGMRKASTPSFRSALALAVVAGLLHVSIEGFRWQLVPAYSAVPVVVLSLLIARRWPRVCLSSLVLILVVAATVASWAFPVFELPEPSGAYAVGKTTVFVTDPSRPETYTMEPDDKRQLALHIWYPSSEPDSGTEVAYWEDATIRSTAVTNGTPFPWFTFTHLGAVKTHARTAASPAEGQFPVLLYSHGLGIGWASGNTALVEELASQGFIVIAIGHAYIASATLFPDHVAYFDPDTRTAMNTEPPEDVMAIYGRVKEIREPEAQLEAYMQAMAMMPVSIKGKVDLALDTQVQDQQFVMQLLPSLRPEAVDLAPHIAPGPVGLLGMSIGGSAAVLSCEQNTACGAVVNLDGFHPAQADVALPVPSLALHRSDNLLVHENYQQAQAEAYLVEVADTTHFNYFDFSIISPLLKQMGILGKIDGQEMIGISRDFVTAFFNTHLKGQPSPLLDGSETHASTQVTLQHRESGRPKSSFTCPIVSTSSRDFPSLAEMISPIATKNIATKCPAPMAAPNVAGPNRK